MRRTTTRLLSAILAFLLAFLFVIFQEFLILPSVTAAPSTTVPNPTHPLQGIQGSSSLKVILILAEFPDAKHTISADEIKKRILTEIMDYYEEASYGLFSLTGDVTPDWITLPKPFSSYGDMTHFIGSDVWSRRQQLATDAIKAADDIIDFKKYDVPVIVVPKVPLIGYSTRVSVSTNDGVTVSSATVQREDRPPGVFAHEIGHTLWLSDLYDHALADKLGSSDAAAIYVGPWCLMSTAFRGTVHFCAYNKIALGWIPYERIKTVSPDSSELVTIEPLEIKTQGIQSVKVPLSSQSYYLVEVRRKIGFDKALPDEGVLITFIDETIKGDGFIKAIDADPSTSSLADATFDARPGKKNIFTDAAKNLAIIVIWSEDNVCGIYITTPSLSEEISKLSNSISQAKSRISQAGEAKFKSPQAQSLLNEAQNKFASSLTFLKSQNYEVVKKETDSVMSLIDQAFSAEQKYAEISEALTQSQNAIKRAENAIQVAESRGRTSGLDEAKDLLQQSKLALDAHNYDRSLVLAIKARKAAETATVPSIATGAYYWYIAALIALVIVAGIAFMLVRKKKRRL